MGCPALGVLVAFLKQTAYKAPQTKKILKCLKKIKIINKESQMNQ
jgi:hypothetical protein